MVVRFHPDEIKRLDAVKGRTGTGRRSRSALVRTLTMVGLRTMEQAPPAAPIPETPEVKP
jgi:hypothetical protein